MSSALLVLKQISLGYNSKNVLEDISFKVMEGDFICIVGANGSGKSTLIKGILGLIKPSAGQIAYQNGLKKTNIGYLPQENKIDLYFPATVREIILSGTLGRLNHRPFYGAKEKSAAADAAKALNIDHLKNQSFTSLSGGQKQKVLLARALAATSKLLILDEPSNNLDHASRQDFYRTLKELNLSGLTIIMITHDLDADDLIGDKVLALKKGHAKLSTTKDFLKRYQK